MFLVAKVEIEVREVLVDIMVLVAKEEEISLGLMELRVKYMKNY